MVGAGLLARNAVARGLRVAPTVKTSLAPGLEGRHRLPRGGRADGAARDARLRPRRLRLHDLHRQLRAARRADRAGDRGERPRRRGGPVGQPQLRGPDPSARAGELPRLAAARRRLRPRRPGRHRPDDRAARHRLRRRGRSSSPTSGRRPDEIRRGHRRARSTRSCSARPTPSSSRATSAGGRCRSPTATATTGTRRSTYIAKPPFFDGLTLEPRAGRGHRRRPGRSPSSATRSRPTTSPRPARSPPGRPPARGSRSTASAPLEFNSYGARRGHHEVMMRGTFGNIRLRNALVAGQGGPVHGPPARRRGAVHLRRRDALPGRGRRRSSSSPAASTAPARRATGRPRAPTLLGVRAVIAESYERIHRSNLVGMGVLPLQFLPGESAASLGLTGRESFTIGGLADGPGAAAADRRRRPTDDGGAASGGSRRSPASTARSRSTTTARAGSCRRSCGGSRAAETA